MTNKLLFLIPKRTNRLVYILNHFCNVQWGLEIDYITDKDEFVAYNGPKVHYGFAAISDEFFIAAEQLLFVRGIEEQELSYGNYMDLPTLFPTYSRSSIINFDVFAASFFLITRYEEYLPFMKDIYGRFPANNSVAYEHGFLQKPLIDIWAQDIAKKLKLEFEDLEFNLPEYKFIPSIDIDAAFAMKHKGALRTIGGYIKGIRDGNIEEITQRTNVILGKEKDPFDTFDFLFDIHQKHGLKPLFFILFAAYGTNDKNTPTYNKKFRNLVAYIADNSDVGIHPSYTSNSINGKLKKEIYNLSNVIHNEITKSRQHFLVLHMPITYRNLINLNITDDYSMGYAHEIGFRASTSRSFLFYDLEMEYTTSLWIHPFAAMEGTLRDYQSLNVEQAYSSFCSIIDEIKAVNGTYISLWHNESVSDKKRWVGWKDLYIRMIEYAI
ncbi:MAG: polysaccharide deacetylase family protein [Bacteroidales bacterium]|nr:polysaccharide deacetylase family protein [Bacteroidales bacterium]